MSEIIPKILPIMEKDPTSALVGCVALAAISLVREIMENGYSLEITPDSFRFGKVVKGDV